jgi:catechol 2,3-dioxygenase-like lactoylglutathione lyase family enzyme
MPDLSAPDLSPPHPVATDTPRMHGAYPQIIVADMARAIGFYTEVLGFTLAYAHGTPAFYALVTRDAAALNLRHVDDPDALRARAIEQVLAANIPMAGVELFHLALLARGADIAQPLQAQPWGATDFVVRDPDGNLLCFASTAPT